MENIKTITLVSENLFDMELDANDFYVFEMKDICGEIVGGPGEFRPIMTCGELIVRFKQSANTILEAPFCQYGTAFNLLDQDRCITQVILTYDNGTTEAVYVPFEGDMVNKCMTTYITEGGDLLLVISPTRTVLEVFGQLGFSLDEG